MAQQLDIIIVERLGSLKTLSIKDFKQEDLYKKCGFKKSEDFKIGFKGSIYPEREKYIKELLNCCNNLNIKVTIEDKNFNGDNDGYWEFMYKHDIIFTTTNQTNIDKNWVDNLNINQLVFRISEALSLGKVLVTTSVDGLEKFFEPEYDFIELKEDLGLEKAFEISIKESLKLAIMKQSGVSDNYAKLIKNKCFWRILDMPEVGHCYESNCRCLNKA